MKKYDWVTSNSLNCTHHRDVHQFAADIIDAIHSSLNKYD